MRLVVTDGSGQGAEVPGYFVGGKTGTAQKTGPRGGYLENKRIAAFVGAFPMHAPRYAIYVMVDEPKPNARSHGYRDRGLGGRAGGGHGDPPRRADPRHGAGDRSHAGDPGRVAIPMQPMQRRAARRRPRTRPRAAARRAPPPPGAAARARRRTATPPAAAPRATGPRRHAARRCHAAAGGRPCASVTLMRRAGLPGRCRTAMRRASPA